MSLSLKKEDWNLEPWLATCIREEQSKTVCGPGEAYI